MSKPLKTLTLPELSEKIGTEGKIFSVVFTKRSNGETREMNCRKGVTKYLKGLGASYNPSEHNLLTVYDLDKEGYRCIPVDGVTKLTCKGKTYYYGTGESNE